MTDETIGWCEDCGNKGEVFLYKKKYFCKNCSDDRIKDNCGLCGAIFLKTELKFDKKEQDYLCKYCRIDEKSH